LRWLFTNWMSWFELVFSPSFLVTSCCVLLSYQKLHLTIPLMSMLVMGHKFWKKNNMFCSPCNALVTIGKAFLLGFVLLRHLIYTLWQFNALSDWQKAYFIPNLYRTFCNDHLTDDLSIHQLIKMRNYCMNLPFGCVFQRSSCFFAARNATAWKRIHDTLFCSFPSYYLTFISNYAAPVMSKHTGLQNNLWTSQKQIPNI